MNIIITGSLGHIGKPLTKILTGQGHHVTVISSNADKKKDIEALGAVAAIGSLEDVDFLTGTFKDANAVFAMIPPNFAAPDPLAYYRRLGNNYAQAIRATGVKQVVQLSSWGAHLEKGTGFIVGSYIVEQIFNKLENVAVTFLRPGSFYYNLYGFVDMIKATGMIGTNYGGDDRIVMVAPEDIADAAAEEFNTPASAGMKIRYVGSEDITATEAARILGAAIGKPDLQWLTFSDEDTQSALEQSGMSQHHAAMLVELNAAIHSGLMREDYDKHPPAVMGKTKLKDFATEFAAAFQ